MIYQAIFDHLNYPTESDTWFEQLEEYITCIELTELLNGHTAEEVLTLEALQAWKEFFKKRWQRISYSTLVYTDNTVSLLNQTIIDLAYLFQGELQISWAQLLMPTLESSISQITATDLIENDINLPSIILSDDYKNFIEVESCLAFAVEDGLLKHTQILEEGRPKQLSSSEKKRVIEHCDESEKYYEAIQKRHKFKHNEKTLGACLQLLINGLRSGGVSRAGEELNAGEIANVAILNFSTIYNSLSPSVQAELNSLKDNWEHDFEYYWNILKNDKTVDITNVILCVELIALGLDEILTNHQTWLFSQQVDEKMPGELNLISCFDDDVQLKRDNFISVLEDPDFNENFTPKWLIKDNKNEYNQLIINLGDYLQKSSQNKLDKIMEMVLRSSSDFTQIEEILDDLTPSLQAIYLNVLTPYLDGYRIKQVAARRHHTLFLTRNGKAYDWGNSGEIVSRDFATNLLMSIQNMDPDHHEIELVDGKIIQIAAGARYSLLLSENNVLFGYGSNCNYPLGFGDDVISIEKESPKIVYDCSVNAVKIRQIAAGNHHSLLLMSNGMVYGCGHNRYNQLGFGNQEYVIGWQALTCFPPNTKIAQIEAGDNYSVFKDSDGKIYCIGKDPSNHIGTGNVVAGKLHSIQVDDNGMAYGAGKNDYGQLSIVGAEHRLLYCNPSILNLMDKAKQLSPAMPSQNGLFSSPSSSPTRASLKRPRPT